nr:MAG TPA: hypothetical protein [Caudoviricetes sp.]
MSKLSIYIGSIEILVVFWYKGAVHVVRPPVRQDPTTCTIDRVANMYHNEGDGPSIFSTPLASPQLPRLARTTLTHHHM